jgi:hypothetical protein
LAFLPAKIAREQDECGAGNGDVIIRSDEIVRKFCGLDGQAPAFFAQV